MDKVIKNICGDAIETMKQLESESIDLIVTDPPYNLSKDYGVSKDNLSLEEYIDFTKSWLTEAHRVLKKNGTIYVFMGMKFISHIYIIMEQEFDMKFNSWITWHYTQGIGKKKGFSPRHDDILMFTKSNNFTFNLDDIRVPQKYYRKRNNMRGANPGNVWQLSHVHYSQKGRTAHPTQKPEALIERIILASSNEGDKVLDPFVGSGTTTRVCQQTNRSCIGIDLFENYIKMSNDRLLEDFTGFDSIDERMLRVPNDLNDSILRKEYIANHIQWFLNNHEKNINDFLDKVLAKYDKKLSIEEKSFYQSLKINNNHGQQISFEIT
ncbi:DNA-methyltransferase [Staphylococcus cohnii]|uniref:DNA-methyltransferase n=1 Tax=Staphylococcaceae TaxID=90964 RepID=UPI003D7EDDA9